MQLFACNVFVCLKLFNRFEIDPSGADILLTCLLLFAATGGLVIERFKSSSVLVEKLLSFSELLMFSSLIFDASLLLYN